MNSSAAATDGRLDSWKAIGAYLRRGVSTVQRWELEEGLPVHRLQHGKGGSVFAYAGELDAWWEARGVALPAERDNGHSDEAGAHPAEISVSTTVASPRVRGFAALAVLGAVAALTVSVAIFVGHGAETRPASRVSQRFDLLLPKDAPLVALGSLPDAADRPVLALSPDGRQLVYVAEQDGRHHLQLIDLPTGQTRVLPGTEGAHSPFFSPRGDALGFFASGKLFRIAADGGQRVFLADAINPWGAAWTDDGHVLFSRLEGEGLFRVSDAGESAVPEPAVANPGTAMPEPLPGGRGLLANIGGSMIWVENGQVKATVLRGFRARYLSSGHLLYAVPERLMAVRFDPRHGSVSGAAVPVASDLRTAPYAVAQYAVSGEGTLVYADGRDQSLGRFVRVDESGASEALGIPERRFQSFSVSPDGQRVAVNVPGDTPASGDIWVYDLGRPESPLRYASGRADGRQSEWRNWPRWAPDGRHLVFIERADTRDDGQLRLVWASADGSEEPRALWTSGRDRLDWLYPMSFSPDGRLLAVFGPSPGTNLDLYTVRLRDEDGSLSAAPRLEPFLQTPAGEVFGQISPDGRAILYQSDESGRQQVYVTTFPKPGARCRVSAEGGTDPSWSRDGRRAFYTSGQGMHAIDVVSVESCQLGRPRVLFHGPFPDLPGFGYDLAPDGHFVMIENDDFSRRAPALKVVTNLLDDLQRRLP